jgi:regulator of sirC expression with transglutaminase-like and TPR domain
LGDKNTIHALVKLLDDTDEEVVNIVESKLIGEGAYYIPELEEIWLENTYPQLNQRIEEIIKRYQKVSLLQDIDLWLAKKEDATALEAWLLVSRVQYPGLKLGMVKAHLNQLKIDAWVKMGGVKNPFDQIQILNHVFFETYGFKGNNENYHNPDNSIITRVMETKFGNPISLSILYMSVAHDLGLPLFGVNLPQHFVLAYCRLNTPMNDNGTYDRDKIKVTNVEKVNFYVNAFSKGQIFTKESVDAFLKVIKVNPQPSFYEPCDNLEIFRRILRNLHFAYSEQQDSDKQRDIYDIMKYLGMVDSEES